jgi:hypothetical protein
VLAGSLVLDCPGFLGPRHARSQSTAQGLGQEDMPVRVQRVRGAQDQEALRQGRKRPEQNGTRIKPRMEG